MKKLSFSQQVKEELTSNQYENVAKLKALLAAYIRITATIVFINKTTYLYISSENAKTIKFIYEKLTSLYKAEIHLITNKGNKRKAKYQIEIVSNVDEIIDDLKIDFLDGKISRETVYNDQTISGYLAGSFLSSGSVNSPHSSDYHLELAFTNENYCKWVGKLFNRFRGYQLEPKKTIRRNKYVIYFKRSDQISNFLVLIGAVHSCMEFENVRVDRDFMNTTNRLSNFDTANMERTIKTAKKQIEEITYIQEVLGLNAISNRKAELLCELRLEHESASMEDLAKLMSEILGKEITKSNINHLFRNIHALYLRIGGDKK